MLVETTKNSLTLYKYEHTEYEQLKALVSTIRSSNIMNPLYMTKGEGANIVIFNIEGVITTGIVPTLDLNLFEAYDLEQLIPKMTV